ncbi:unnamed protein product [Gongylonema pulchrum]|uniref:TldD/PmbA family protein n=1 Tax=Gongylonema pulchrum TaxID=637853 RepID=A0A183DGP6_9BILA|nr:unnamed protein product [Gongylonema pulchrum]
MRYYYRSRPNSRCGDTLNADDVGTHVALELLNGSLGVRTRLGGKKVYSSNIEDKIDDNRIAIDGVEKAKFDVENRFDHPLLADALILGSSDSSPEGTFSTNDYFKGTLQDVRINDRVVPLTELPADVEAQQFGVRVKEENILQTRQA